MEPLSPQDEIKFQELIRQLTACHGMPCSDCVQPLIPEDILFSNALGFKDHPRCLGCLSNRLKREKNELKSHLLQHIQRRPCLAKAYQMACPTSLTCAPTPPPEPTPTAIPLHHHELWNAGDLGCGDLVLLLKGKLRALPGGSILKVIANDPGAPEDIPAWCNLTKHRLVSHQHPEYFIQSKD